MLSFLHYICRWFCQVIQARDRLGIENQKIKYFRYSYTIWYVHSVRIAQYGHKPKCAGKIGTWRMCAHLVMNTINVRNHAFVNVTGMHSWFAHLCHSIKCAWITSYTVHDTAGRVHRWHHQTQHILVLVINAHITHMMWQYILYSNGYVTSLNNVHFGIGEKCAHVRQHLGIHCCNIQLSTGAYQIVDTIQIAPQDCMLHI